MKTTYSAEEVALFLAREYPVAATSSLQPMAEGHSSQVFSFKTITCDALVMRIRSSEKDLLADRYAYANFSSTLPVPMFKQIGRFDDTTYYCITELIQGRMLNSLSEDEFNQYLPVVQQSLADTFYMDISTTSGYGNVNSETGNGSDISWKKSLENELGKLDIDSLKQNAKNINLPDGLVDRFVDQFRTNLPYVSEVRRLLHGDPGWDNMLVSEGRVVAVIDWEQMAYGDWVRDFSRFSYSGLSSYGDIIEFANRFNLEAESIRERVAAYWAINALRDIEFADRHPSDKVANWLRKNAANRLVI